MIGIVLACMLVVMSLYIFFQCIKKKKIPTNYWDVKGVTTLDHNVILKGNEFISIAEKLTKVYLAYKSKGLKHIGHIEGNTLTYTAIDPNVIRQILVKDFDHFANRGLDYDVVNNPLSEHLFNIEDEVWRNWRVKLTPTFTTGKMRMMFPNITKCASGMTEIFEDYASKKHAIDIKEILACYTTDVIGCCVFGIECNCLKNPDADFRVHGKNYITEVSKVNQKMPLHIKLLPAFVRKSISPQFQAIREMLNFFRDIVNKNVEYREKNNIHRKDFMHMLMEIKNTGFVSDDHLGAENLKQTITMTQLTAQAFGFYVAGFETSSTLMIMACYELATHKDIQDVLRHEIISIIEKHGGFTYDAINEMNYLEKVVNETMRLHPPLPQLFRICTKDYTIPESDILLKRGTNIRVDICALHRDPEYYPDPDQFDPENFNKERSESRPDFTYLPFGNGPRNCIGLRFGKLQAKIGLITLLKDYKIRLNEKTEYPMKYNPWQFMVQVNGELYLDLEKIH